MAKTSLTLRGLLAKLSPQQGWVITELAHKAQQYERNGVTLLVLPTVEVSRLLGAKPPLARLTDKALSHIVLGYLWEGELADQLKLPSAKKKEAVLQAISQVQQGLRVLMCIRDLGTFEANTAWQAQQKRLQDKLMCLQSFCKSE